MIKRMKRVRKEMGCVNRKKERALAMFRLISCCSSFLTHSLKLKMH